MTTVPPSFVEALRFWSLLGWISFGGPAGQIAIMHRELVERRRWVDEATFLHGLNFCMLLPGPEATQLATYLGWRLHGLRGGLAAGALFVLPATTLMALLSWSYLHFGQSAWVRGISLGLSAAVLALLLQALQRLGRRVLGKPFAWVLAGFALIALGWFRLGFPWLVGIVAVLGLAVGHWRPQWLPMTAQDAGAVAERGPEPRIGKAVALALGLLSAWWLPLLGVRVWLGGDSTAWAVSRFFSEAALVTFGGAYAVLPHVARQAVEVHGWLSAEQMLAGLGLAETTPGPLILVLEFVGFLAGWQQPDLPAPLASALLCAAISVWATFLPSFLFVLPAAPWIERLREVPRLSAALAAITAAVMGVIAQLALWFGGHLFAAATPATAAFLFGVAGMAHLALRREHHVLLVVVAAAGLGAGWTTLGLPA